MRVLFGSIAIATLLVGCAAPAAIQPSPTSSAPTPSTPNPKQVLATTTLFADMAANVGGNRVKVESIVPAGSHVEEFEPKPEDSKKVATADLIIKNGLDLDDPWADPLLKDKKKDATVVTLTEGLTALNDNPHMWFDLQLARKYVEKIRDALIAVDASGRDYYMTRAKSYDDQLVKLDGDVRAQIATIPAARRKLVTSHDAFAYFAKAYGLEIIGFAQPEPGKDPSPAELARLVKDIKAAGVPAIFSEVGVSPAIAQTLAKEAGVTKIVTDLPTDSIVAPPADTFIGVVRTVTQKITDALK
jgi:ABC-type Zn uptake system ZnuABC Zn-binding protein ZnuA